MATPDVQVSCSRKTEQGFRINNREAFNNACDILCEEKGITLEAAQAEVDELPATQKTKAERAIAKFKAALFANMKAQFDKELAEKVAERQKLLDETRAHLQEERKKLRVQSTSIKRQMTKDEYRVLLQLLHPDHASDDRKEKFAKGFAIIKRFDTYVGDWL